MVVKSNRVGERVSAQAGDQTFPRWLTRNAEWLNLMAPDGARFPALHPGVRNEKRPACQARRSVMIRVPKNLRLLLAAVVDRRPVLSHGHRSYRLRLLPREVLRLLELLRIALVRLRAIASLRLRF